MSYMQFDSSLCYQQLTYMFNVIYSIIYTCIVHFAIPFFNSLLITTIKLNSSRQVWWILNEDCSALSTYNFCFLDLAPRLQLFLGFKHLFDQSSMILILIIILLWGRGLYNNLHINNVIMSHKLIKHFITFHIICECHTSYLKIQTNLSSSIFH